MQCSPARKRGVRLPLLRGVRSDSSRIWLQDLEKPTWLDERGVSVLLGVIVRALLLKSWVESSLFRPSKVEDFMPSKTRVTLSWLASSTNDWG